LRAAAVVSAAAAAGGQAGLAHHHITITTAGSSSGLRENPPRGRAASSRPHLHMHMVHIALLLLVSGAVAAASAMQSADDRVDRVVPVWFPGILIVIASSVTCCCHYLPNSCPAPLIFFVHRLALPSHSWNRRGNERHHRKSASCRVQPHLLDDWGRDYIDNELERAGLPKWQRSWDALKHLSVGPQSFHALAAQTRELNRGDAIWLRAGAANGQIIGLMLLRLLGVSTKSTLGMVTTAHRILRQMTAGNPCDLIHFFSGHPLVSTTTSH